MRDYKIEHGQLWVWDDSPREEFGQMWMAVCVGCGDGPLCPTDGLVCGDCDARERES